ncbi:hypothetical protein ACI3KS_15290 [Microbacterium sp. ZW T5_45]|uniref:hypothetical protein n=1 Tax=Microbacterium sp. ZW T5_45 TaxID=3378080 RepID=UPI003851F304
MSTSDQQGPLTRKQLRELRRTGSTPVIGAEETVDESAVSGDAVSEDAVSENHVIADVPAAPPVPPLPTIEPVALPAAEVSPAEDRIAESTDGAPLTRRQAREQERIKTASVPVQGEDSGSADDAAEPAPALPQPSDDDDDDVDEHVDVVPVSAAAASEVPLVFEPAPEAELPPEAGPASEDHDVDAAAAVAELGIDVPVEDDRVDEDDLLADAGDPADALADDERPIVSPAFGQGVLADTTPVAPAAPSFDDLLASGDSAGSHTASNTLIFTPAPGDGALDGPVASTGEILVTGSYELPQGLGSQGHATGVADGKDVDAVLIDGELPPASSPTPIAASAAVSTIKPAGEVIRPPAPEKGNKLMLTLAIVAGGLALALGVVLVIAFTTNVL